ncbi:MAG: hypothetical protein Ct9H90mP25_5670 [Gammaproteobacteria bacterium]|nr:MAG: hypothetical protein Ct9H90mP25_5670 [Gammaproteobacteria bacterium]
MYLVGIPTEGLCLTSLLTIIQKASQQLLVWQVQVMQMKGQPQKPSTVLQIHGTDDSTIRYEGGDIQGNDSPGEKGKRNSMGRIQSMH